MSARPWHSSGPAPGGGQHAAGVVPPRDVTPRTAGRPAELASAGHRLQRFDCAPAPTRAHASKAAVGRDGCAAARQRGDAEAGGGRRTRADGVGKLEVGAGAGDARAHKERDVERSGQLQDVKRLAFD